MTFKTRIREAIRTGMLEAKDYHVRTTVNGDLWRRKDTQLQIREAIQRDHGYEIGARAATDGIIKLEDVTASYPQESYRFPFDYDRVVQTDAVVMTQNAYQTIMETLREALWYVK